MSWLLRAWRTVTSWTRRPPDGDLDRELRLDLRLAARLLAKHWRFSALAVLVLSLATGANTALFSVANAVLLKPLPVHRPGQLVWIYGNDRSNIPYDVYRDYRDEMTTVTGLAGFELMAASVRFGEGARVLSGAAVTGNYFEVLGIQPWLGRLMASSDVTETDAREVVVLGHDLWQGRFDADPGVVGRSVQLNGRGDAPGGRSQPALGDDRTGHRYRGIVGLEPAREQLSVRRESDRADHVRRRRAATRPCGGACQSRSGAPRLPDRPDDGALGRVVRNPLRSRRIPAGLAGLGQSLASTTETPIDTAVPGPSRLRNQHA